MNLINIDAPAKINLYLEIISRRRDGYHNIETIFQKIGLCDTIRVSRRKRGISVGCDSRDVPCDRRNLVYKAASLMKRKFGIPDGFDIYIEKRIPTAAGLGGGSSDAAATMLAIKKLYALETQEIELIPLARQIGADVPFFVSGYDCASGRGIGDVLNQIQHKLLWHILILTPCFNVYTSTIYKKASLALTKHRRSANMLVHTLSCLRREHSIGRLLYNRLEEIVLPIYPLVKEAKDILSSYETDGVLLSGSGPSVFALFRDRKEAIRARNKLKIDSRWRVFLTRTL